MEDLEAVAARIRAIESEDDYRYQQAFTSRDGNDYKVGAYGMRLSAFKQLADAAGIPQARWQDKGAQDYVAKEKLRRDYERLGSWDMAVVAFRFGTRAAEALTQRGYTTPEGIEAAGQKEIAEYLRGAKANEAQKRRKVTGRTGARTATKTNPKGTRAQEVVRKQLYGLRNQQRRTGVMEDGGNEDVQQGGDTNISDEAQ